MLLDIVICTYNRGNYLSKCLESLLNQVQSFENVGLFVVDNNSTDNTKKVVEGFQQKVTKVRYVSCLKQGLGFARNKAIEECNAEWLAFIDDDAYAEKNWLENILRIIHEGKFDAFGGVYYPWYAEGKVPWFKDCYETNDTWMPPGDEFRLTQGYFSGGNSVFNVGKLRAAGGFPVGIGMNGNFVGYGEEVATQRTMAINGSRLGFSRRLIIHHLVPMRKQRWQWAWKRSFASGRDFWAIYSKETTRENLFFYIKSSLFNTFRVTAMSLKLFLSGNHNFKCLLYESGKFAYISGLIFGYCQMEKL
ncbi:glycosyltransferase family 2 protein [Geoalkalibacter halelectricus]|uniref:Glycosyltransferase family 2 protein n=1 Tax=Geoalkalibacter halelectricus TaxID=2847045 RepID=A0ABY5ZUJ7_9BACT|nr:glycosyltransferase family 2 protein [Geoalkalibacter halelectricus]MDO3377967.1 glycosyltransferase family 2 protein [Geoalkalibacter halelectricus]UWZ81530.1 glycosyltransferase family 2 protein [Geoalkalibacter halelectricus]